jgi:hypothetical protein
VALNGTVPDGVEATARDGNVWPTVNYGSLRKAAEMTAAGLTGVRNVTDLVQGALGRYGLFADDSDVTVDASDGALTLADNVRGWLQHGAVTDAAWVGIGVSDVRDDLRVIG